MADKLQISIIGLGLIGRSAGLALRRYADKITVVGHDKNTALAGQAKSAGAVDRTEWNLINAVRNADRVLLALPLDEIQETLKIIAQDLKPGCLLLDTADVKAPVLRWAAELLPANVSLVGGHPIILAESLDAGGARADLFTDKLFCLTPAARADDTAVRLATDLVEALGARPYFVDVTEHDGMAAAVEHLPALMAGALLSATSGSSGWNDLRKLAGVQFYSSTLLAAGEAGPAVRAAAANREHVTRWLDLLIAELTAWRQQLADDTGDTALIEALESGLTARHTWLRAQASGVWEETVPMAEIPGTGAMLGQLIGMGKTRKPPQAKGKR